MRGKEDPDDPADIPEIETRFRVDISVSVFSLLQTVAWVSCQIIMLHVFYKYGRSVEEDSMQLFRNKLESLYQKANTPEAQRARRQRAVNEIVNRRIEAIVRTMTSYAPAKDLSLL